jgi:gamma-glutamylcyclotransferase (GGCT)/AIG2-like uncharacterized protein YtfP
MPHVFVYGTLKRGGSNHALLAGQRFAGAARTVAAYRLHQLEGYPGMVRAETGGRSIEGEVWEVDVPCLGRLDQLEGTDQGLYVRAPVALLAPWADCAAETYLYARSVEGRRDLGSSFG